MRVALLVSVVFAAFAASAIEWNTVGITGPPPSPPSYDECVLGTATLPCDLGAEP